MENVQSTLLPPEVNFLRRQASEKKRTSTSTVPLPPEFDEVKSPPLPPEFQFAEPKEYSSAEEAEMDERLSFAQLSSDDEYMDMLRDYNSDRFGDSGAQKKDESDEEYLKRFLTHTREFEWNSIDLGRQLDWVRTADQDQRMRFGYVYSQLARLPSFYQEGGTGWSNAVKDFGKSLVTDPFNYIGFGAGAVAKNVAVRGITKALKEGGKQAAMKEASKYGASKMFRTKAGAIVGGGIVAESGVAAIQDLKLQEIEMLSQKDGEFTADDYDYGRALLTGTLGLGLGIGGAKLSGGLGGKNLINNAEEVVAKQKKVKDELAARNTEFSAKLSDEATTQTASGVFDLTAGREALDTLGTIADDATFEAQIQFNTDLMQRVGKVVTETVQELADDGRLERMIDQDTKASEVIGTLVKDALARAKGSTPKEIREQTQQLLTGEKGILKEIGDFSGDTLEAAIKRSGLTNEQFINAMGASYSDAGKYLQTASNVGKIIKKIGEVDPELKAILIQNEKSDNMLGLFGKAHQLMGRLDRERRALMVTQVATTVRNVATGVTRLGMETVADSIESAIYQLGRGSEAAMTGNMNLGSGNFKDIIRDSFGRLNRLRQVTNTAELADGLLRHNTRLASRMDRTLQEAADDEALSGFTRTMNGLNIAQDIFFRRAIFTNSVEKKLRRAGVVVNNPTKVGQFKSIEEFVASGKTLPASVLSDAVEDSLSFTFSRMPQAGGKRAGDTVGHHFVKLTEAVGPVPLPIGTAAMPFARFMVNALQFQVEYSPLSSVNSVYKYATAKHTQKMAKLATDTTKVKKMSQDAANQMAEGKKMSQDAANQMAEARSSFSKALVGTAAFYAAIQYRANNQDVKFFEYKTEDGSTGDLRPFFPLVPYLAVADLIVKYSNKDSDKINFKETAEAFTGFQFRTGASSYILDNAEQLVSSLGSADAGKQQRIMELVGGYVGELTGGYATPLRIVRDVQAAYDTEAAVVRDARQATGIGTSERFMSALKNTVYKDLPELSKTLPAVESATRESDIYRQSPLVGQVTGLRKEAIRNPAEQEFARLGIRTFELVPGSGDKTADALVKKYLGGFVEESISELVESEEYLSKTETQKRGLLNKEMKLLRVFAKELAVVEAEMEMLKGPKSYTPFDRAQYGKLTDIQTRLADEYYKSKYGKSVIEMVEEEPDTNHYKRAIDLGKLLQKNL